MAFVRIENISLFPQFGGGSFPIVVDFIFASSLTVNGEVVYSILSVYVKCSGLGSVSSIYLMWSNLLLDLKLIEYGGARLKNAKVGESAHSKKINK